MFPALIFGLIAATVLVLTFLSSAGVSMALLASSYWCIVPINQSPVSGIFVLLRWSFAASRSHHLNATLLSLPWVFARSIVFFFCEDRFSFSNRLSNVCQLLYVCCFLIFHCNGCLHFAFARYLPFYCLRVFQFHAYELHVHSNSFAVFGQS